MRLSAGCMVSIAERAMEQGESWQSSLARMMGGFQDVVIQAARKKDERAHLIRGGVKITDRDAHARENRAGSILQLSAGLAQRSARHQLNNAPKVASIPVSVSSAGIWCARVINYVSSALVRLDTWVALGFSVHRPVPRLA